MYRGSIGVSRDKSKEFFTMVLAYGDYENGILPVDLTHSEAIYLQELLMERACIEVEEAKSINSKIGDQLYSYAHWQNNRHTNLLGKLA